RYSTNNASPALKRRVTLCPNASSNIHLAPTSSFTSSNLFISCHLAYLYLINLGSRSYLVVGGNSHRPHFFIFSFPRSRYPLVPVCSEVRVILFRVLTMEKKVIRPVRHS
ncbi:hypothetical protein WG66_010936, partial [Moniliophthora roreri]